MGYGKVKVKDILATLQTVDMYFLSLRFDWSNQTAARVYIFVSPTHRRLRMQEKTEAVQDLFFHYL